MSFTPAEAKTKWCPFAVVAEASPSGVLASRPAFNRVEAGNGFLNRPDASSCLATGCMMWRWNDDVIPREELNEFTRPGSTRKSTTHGHCGLSAP